MVIIMKMNVSLLFLTTVSLIDRTVLLAIIYVLSRTENLHCPEINVGNLDLGEVREQLLAQTPPHIIECADAKEG